jgi:rRNA maturation RNase YbeY
MARHVRRAVRATLQHAPNPRHSSQRTQGRSRTRPRPGRGSIEPACEIAVSFVSDAQIADCNRRWLGHAGPTDVLTFDLRDDPRSPVPCGEIVVSRDTARREARARGHSPRREALLYVVHGVLHLLGYDDARPAGRRRMNRLQAEILSRLR